MQNRGQGVQLKSRLSNLLLIQLLLTYLLFAIATSVHAADTRSDHGSKAQGARVYFIQLSDNTLHAEILRSLSEQSGRDLPGVEILPVTANEKAEKIDQANDLIIAVGRKSIQYAETLHPDISKLNIATDRGKYKPDIGMPDKTAVLYMAQPYCRQINFIRSINKYWKTISILRSQDKALNLDDLERCSKKYDFRLYSEETTAQQSLSDDLKNAITNSDVLLALPDKSIYNNKTVKNILLTSYRYRKPVIAFSGNFVKAGALASIHSSPEQIAKSAIKLIKDYFKNSMGFTQAVNYPQLFDVSINRQVFKALGLPAPDINKLKHDIVDKDPKEPGH